MADRNVQRAYDQHLYKAKPLIENLLAAIRPAASIVPQHSGGIA